MEYRVVEFLGRFRIQVKKVTTKTTGHLWWKKTKVKTEWVSANEKGDPLWFAPYTPSPPPAMSFETLAEAMHQIDLFKAGYKYYYPDIDS